MNDPDEWSATRRQPIRRVKQQTQSGYVDQACIAGVLPVPMTDQITHRCRSLAKVIMLTCISISISACGFNLKPGGATNQRTLVPSPQLASRLLAEGDTVQAAHVYAQLANSATDPARKQEYQLTATELYFDSELYNDGMRLFASLPTTLNTPAMQSRLQILTAYNSLAQGSYEDALRQLPPTRSLTDRILTIRTLELQSRAYQQVNKPDLALKARILLEGNLTVAQSIELNRTKIASMLAALDMDTLRTMASTPGGSIYRGWLEYSALARRQATMTPERYAQRNDAWRARYPNHPAATISLAGVQSLDQLTPSIVTDQVALLLPLTGQFSEIGDAIKTGFIAARFNAGGSTNIKLYDTASNTGTAIQQYERATADGASLVVGPLDKTAVINLTAGNRINVPTLSLNYIGDGMPGHANLFQFGLLPEDEARDGANYALQQNYRKAVVIASDSPISQRLAIAFEQTFSSGGGEILASDVIASDSYDYSQQLTKILAINSSYSRKRRLEKLFDTTIEFEPAIRGDIDVIFMAVDSEQALLLRPQLKFQHAGKVPLISTSQVFNGDADSDRDGDLTGIKYNDIPWTLTDANSGSPLYRTINQTHQDSIQKLIALGVDAYQLHEQLENLRLDPTLSLDGKTGALSLAEGNRIRRRLEWAEFQEGVPVKISGALAVETTLPALQGEL